MADFLNPYYQGPNNPYTMQPMNPQFNQYQEALRNAYQQAVQPMQQFQQQLQNPNTAMQAQNPVPGFVIRTATDVEEVKSTPFVNPDGSPDLVRTYLFVNAAKGEIYVSKIGSNGLKDTKTYIAKTETDATSVETQDQEQKPDILQIMNERLERIEKRLEENQNGSEYGKSDELPDEDAPKRVKPTSNSKPNAK